VSEYKAARQLVELTCAYCHTSRQVDAEDQKSVEASASWLMIVPSDGTKVALCGKAHAVLFLQEMPMSKIEIVRS